MRLELSPSDLCHAVLRRKPFTDEGWLFELKHDGFRAFVRRSASGVELLSRNARSMAKAFPEIVAAIATLPDAVLDAELIVPDSAGRSDFGELQRRSLMRKLVSIDDAAVRRPAALIVFDVLQTGRADMRPLLDSVKQRDRLNDNHLGRLVGDDCRRLLVHVVAPVND